VIHVSAPDQETHSPNKQNPFLLGSRHVRAIGRHRCRLLRWIMSAAPCVDAPRHRAGRGSSAPQRRARRRRRPSPRGSRRRCEEFQTRRKKSWCPPCRSAPQWSRRRYKVLRKQEALDVFVGHVTSQEGCCRPTRWTCRSRVAPRYLARQQRVRSCRLPVPIRWTRHHWMSRRRRRSHSPQDPGRP
jgi:hypothetical protein